MTWEPYDHASLAALPEICVADQHIWRTRSPLICFDIVEWHFPDRVFRQFGMTQHIPRPCDMIAKLHKTDKRGKPNVDWAIYHSKYITLWDQREGERSIQEAEPASAPMIYSDPYMSWYRRITRRFITTDAHCSSSDYQPSALPLHVLIEHCLHVSQIARQMLDDPECGIRHSTGEILRSTSVAMERVGQQHIIQPSTSATSTSSARPSTRQASRPPTPSSPMVTPSPSTFTPVEQPFNSPSSHLSSTLSSLFPYPSFSDSFPRFSSYSALLGHSGPLPSLQSPYFTPPPFRTPYRPVSYFIDTHLSHPPSTMSLSPIVESPSMEHSHTPNHIPRTSDSTGDGKRVRED